MCSIIDAVNAVKDVFYITSEIQEIRTEKAYLKQEIALNEQKARNEKQKAESEYQEGLEESRKKRLEAILNMGDVSTKLAANNIALNSGSAFTLAESEKQKGELSALYAFNEHKSKYNAYMDSSSEYLSAAQLGKAKKNKLYSSTVFQKLNSSADNLLSTIYEL